MPQIKARGAEEWGFVARDVQMSQTKAAAALKFLTVQQCAVYVHAQLLV